MTFNTSAPCMGRWVRGRRDSRCAWQLAQRERVSMPGEPPDLPGRFRKRGSGTSQHSWPFGVLVATRRCCGAWKERALSRSTRAPYIRAALGGGGKWRPLASVNRRAAWQLRLRRSGVWPLHGRLLLFECPPAACSQTCSQDRVRRGRSDEMIRDAAKQNPAILLSIRVAARRLIRRSGGS